MIKKFIYDLFLRKLPEDMVQPPKKGRGQKRKIRNPRNRGVI